MPMYFALVKYILIVKFQVIDLKGKKIYIFTFINNKTGAVQRGYSGSPAGIFRRHKKTITNT